MTGTDGDPVPAVMITVNGEERAVDAGTTVTDLLATLAIEPRGVAVAVDGEVVTRRTWPRCSLAGGERVEILTIAQGG